MSKLNDLINKLCTEGVEFRGIGELADYEQPSKYIVKSTDYNDDFDIPVLTAGQSFILGYTNEKDGIYNATPENPVIIFDDFTGAFKWVDFPFKVKSSAMKMIKAKKDITFLRYIYHLMSYLNFTSNEHKRLWISIYSELQVPVPPLEVQREIVRVLDSFTLLTAELTAELTARKQQYECYREKLLSFDNEVDIYEIGEICRLSAGGDVPKDDFSETRTEEYQIPIISNGIGEKGLYGYTNTFKVNEPSVTVAARGAGVGYVTYRDYPYYPIIRLVSVIPKEKILTKYLYYAMQKIKFEPTKGGIPQLTVPMISKYKIPVPPIEVQKRIVSILEKFEVLCEDFSTGIPAEIEARKKQYEYYRDKIISFEEIGDVI